jgi:hypothetical protein
MNDGTLTIWSSDKDSGSYFTATFNDGCSTSRRRGSIQWQRPHVEHDSRRIALAAEALSQMFAALADPTLRVLARQRRVWAT